MLSRLFSFFFLGYGISSLLLTRTLLRQSEKHFDKKERILVIWGGAFIIKEEISRRRDFLFLFFFEHKEGKKDTFETKRIISSSSEESARFERTQTHTKPEREKDDAFFFSDIYLLFVYFVFVLFARYREREKERRHFIISPLCKREREHRD